MTKLELKKTDKTYYTTHKDWHRVTLPPIPYLAITGEGAPEGPGYAEAMQALYPLAYAIKFRSKGEGRDFTVPPVSTQWWADDPTVFTTGDRAAWKWRALIRMPDWVDQAYLDAARATAKPGPRRDEVTLDMIDEGDCFQMLHIGPYSEEAPKLARLHDEIMPEAQVTFGLPHHEIYISNPGRTAPEKLKTILRQPVVPIPK
ncbi:GyrI-like domain-containing protein [Maritimibacter dapengensis]|uniref:GyrI-like domain-containing protein n=1 Tax=Maritimibacter dapengensis TaxID=2836868 RepID=A0ABS6SWT3_9RHOB|nr:GyrI-like domain-containing protein [Maritimibacter dapengensis]MBV7377413.1 GyrI-like domain-containing protein [Maritimibacter dapengensis]